MAAYRIPEFTLEQRLDVALRMLAPDRAWGMFVNRKVTHMIIEK